MAAFANSGTTPTVDSPGDVLFVDMERFQVLLPTDLNWDLVLDPQGLLSMEVGDTASVADLASDAGNIVARSHQAVINESSVPVALTAQVRITGSGFTVVNPVSPNIGGSAAQVSLANAASTTSANIATLDGDALQTAVNTGTANNVAMFLAPTADAVSDVDDDYTYGDASFLIPSGSTGASLTFVLEAADYNIEATATGFNPVLEPGTGNGTILQLGGFINRNANWNTFNPTTNPTTGDPVAPRNRIGVSTVYRWAKATDVQVTAMSNPDFNYWNARFRPAASAAQVNDVALTWATDVWAAADRTAAAAAPFPGVYGLLASSVTTLNMIEDAPASGGIERSRFTTTFDTRTIAQFAGAGLATTWFEMSLVSGVTVPATGVTYTVRRGANTSQAITPTRTAGTTGTAATVNTWLDDTAAATPRIGINLSTTGGTVLPVALNGGVTGPIAVGDVVTITVTFSDGSTATTSFTVAAA
jgi:hypothetical protein